MVISVSYSLQQATLAPIPGRRGLEVRSEIPLLHTYIYTNLTETAVLFPTNEAPHYKYSYHILIMFNGIGVIGMLYPKFIDPQM
jgi:hypothetical protein